MEAGAKRLLWGLQHAKVPSLGARGQEGGEPTSKTGMRWHEPLGSSDLRAALSPPKGVVP